MLSNSADSHSSSASTTNHQSVTVGRLGRYCSGPRRIKFCLNSAFIINVLRCLSQICRFCGGGHSHLKVVFAIFRIIPVEPSSASTRLNIDAQGVDSYSYHWTAKQFNDHPSTTVVLHTDQKRGRCRTYLREPLIG